MNMTFTYWIKGRTVFLFGGFGCGDLLELLNKVYIYSNITS
jgi:hypothetical protein